MLRISGEPKFGHQVVLVPFRPSYKANRIGLVATEALLTLFKLSTDLPLLLSTLANLFSITVASIHIADASKMSWRNNQGITGSNNIPLGKRRFGGDDEGASEASTPTVAASENGATRGRSPTRGKFEPTLPQLYLF